MSGSEVSHKLEKPVLQRRAILQYDVLVWRKEKMWLPCDGHVATWETSNQCNSLSALRQLGQRHWANPRISGCYSHLLVYLFKKRMLKIVFWCRFGSSHAHRTLAQLLSICVSVRAGHPCQKSCVCVKGKLRSTNLCVSSVEMVVA